MTLDFCKGWTFQKEGEAPVTVTLPHDAMLLEKRDGECRNGVNSGYFPGGKYIYEKSFVLSSQEAEKSLVLHFEGVYQNCTISLNGEQIGGHRYGYTPFDVDLTGKAAPGVNQITVQVDNSLEPNCRWYSGSGIYRPVKLLIRDTLHIHTVHIQTLSIHPPTIQVEASATETVPITVEIRDGEEVVASGSPGIFILPNAQLWSAECPYLYTCIVKAGADTQQLQFGIRTLHWNPKAGLCINEKSVLLRGGCIHHDHGVLGAAEYWDAEARRIRILKENGFNAIRIAHHPASQITLELCDRLGMYVMNESFDGWYIPKTYHDYARWFEADWKSDMTAMVESSRNHPSVILYSIGNEVSETAAEKGAAVCRMLRDYVHSLDATRPVTAGINVLLNVYARMGMGVYREKGNYKPEPLPKGKAYQEKKTGSAFFNAMTQRLGKLMFFMASGSWGDKACQGAAQGLDILGLNYASSRYDPDVKNHPERLMVGAETMAADLPYNWERVKKHPQLIGDFVWAAWDYLGEACMGWTYSSYKGLPLLANQGMIDITGKPLASMAFMQVVWGMRQAPFLAVRPLNHAGESPTKGSWQFTDAIDSWNWPGYEGTRATVEVYAPGASLRLLLNGKVIGVKPLKEFRVVFHVLYAPGELTAEALDADGKLLTRHSLVSGGQETRLTALPDKTTLRAGSPDLCCIPIEFTDEHGLLKPALEQRVELDISGSAKLLGFGSALYKTEEGFSKPWHTAYRGRCYAVLQGTDTPGTATITIRSENITPTVIKLEVI